MRSRRAVCACLLVVLVSVLGCRPAPITTLSPSVAPVATTEPPPSSATPIPTVEPTPATESTRVPETATAGPGTAETLLSSEVDTLAGLPLDAFFDASFELLLRRDPEWITTEGLTARLGASDDHLTDLSDAYVRETQALQREILALLQAYDRSALTPEQQISYDVYAWYLEDLIAGQPFTYYDYPINPIVTGVQYQLRELFTDIQPVTDKASAEAYIARLTEVDAKFTGLIEGLRLRGEAGVVLPRALFPSVTGDIAAMARSAARSTPFYTAFQEKVGALDLASAEKQALLQSAEEAIEQSVKPAYARLLEALQELQSMAPREMGIGHVPEGEAYYAYALRHLTTTDMTPDEIHELGLRELERIHSEMRAAFRALGYPADAPIAELYARLGQESGTVSGPAVAAAYESIIRTAEGRLDVAFDMLPQADVIVIAGDRGTYYTSAALDGSRPGAFYARTAGIGVESYSMPTVAYHETIPGHHLQIALAQESDLPLFRNVVIFLGYTEGWALYAEQLAYELGWYDDDPYGNLGRLRDQAFRAARLVVDTGIHAKGWTFEQALAFMVENVGRDRTMLASEVARYVVWPGQATAYMVGMLDIIALRQEAMDRLGDRFDLREFHHVVLSNGSMPLTILERVVEDYIAAELAQESP